MGAIGFYLFGRFIAYYGLMIVIGILINLPLAYYQIKKFQLSTNDFFIICGISALLAIIGAKILYLLISYKYIDFSRLIDLEYVNSLMNGGFVFLGGIAGFIVAITICEKVVHITVQPYIQACIGCVPIGHACGRIGCFLVGCCYGVPYTGLLSVVYTHSQFAPCGMSLFPVQLVEAFIEFVLGGCLLLFSKKMKGRFGLYLYLFVYSLSRFFLEFLRYDGIRGGIANLSTSQILSIVLFLYSLHHIKRCKDLFFAGAGLF